MITARIKDLPIGFKTIEGGHTLLFTDIKKELVGQVFQMETSVAFKNIFILTYKNAYLLFHKDWLEILSEPNKKRQ